ncbi:MAG: DUF1775 domain-containing protein [Pseudomonadales bacterium]|nr:DUF1775 domain-containing protein [Pseudomonadales bacterium]
MVPTHNKKIKHLFGLATLTLSSSVLAHVTVTSDTGFANAYYQVDLAIPHGCSGADTHRVEVSIPSSLTSIRAVLGDLGYASFETDSETGNVTKIIWDKPLDDLLAADSHTYNISFRTQLPDAPFTTLHFPTVQYCQNEMGDEYVSEWVGSGGHDHSGGNDSTLPAPSLFIYPQRNSGWNKYVAPDHLHDISIFNDAEIVWKGNAA